MGQGEEATRGIHAPQPPVTQRCSLPALCAAFLSRVVTRPLPRTRVAPAPLKLARGRAGSNSLVNPQPSQARLGADLASSVLP